MKKIVLCFLFICCVYAQSHDSDAIKFPESEEEHIHLNSRINLHNHHHHHHSHDEGPTLNEDSSKEIPLTLIQKLNEVNNLPDLLANYLEGEEELVEEFSVSSRFGGKERAGAIMPKPATCTPTLQTVELKNSNDSSLFFFPPCTRVERCNGCCSHNLLSCQPVQTETVGFQVIISQYTGGNKLSVRGKEIIFVEKHTKCRCDCKMKQEDCNSFQEYRKDECRCICANIDEKKKCYKQNDTKLWDPTICKCKCRDVAECTTGLYFDQNKCTCLSIPVRRRFAELGKKERPFNEKESYDVDSLSVIPRVEEKSDEKDAF